MKLHEIFDSPLPTAREVKHDGLLVMDFFVDSIKYEIAIGEMNPGNWEVSFDAQLPQGERVNHATGTGNEVKVFSTVYNYVNQFLRNQTERVKTLVFTSDLASRSKLYKRLAALWAKQNGMTATAYTNQYDEDEFKLVNPNYKK